MTPEQIEHLRTLASVVSAPVAAAMFVGAYWLHRAKRRNGVYYVGTASMILACWLAAYLVDHTFRIFAVIGSAGLAAFQFGKARAMAKHPEVFTADGQEHSHDLP